MAEYVNEILPGLQRIEIQGETMIVDPLKFTVSHEIAIRQAFEDERLLVEKMTKENVNMTLLEARKTILACGLSVIPKVTIDFTEDDVKNLSPQAIGVVLNFFLTLDWRKVTLNVLKVEPLETVAINTSMTPETPISKPKRMRG